MASTAHCPEFVQPFFFLSFSPPASSRHAASTVCIHRAIIAPSSRKPRELARKRLPRLIARGWREREAEYPHRRQVTIGIHPKHPSVLPSTCCSSDRTASFPPFTKQQDGWMGGWMQSKERETTNKRNPPIPSHSNAHHSGASRVSVPSAPVRFASLNPMFLRKSWIILAGSVDCALPLVFFSFLSRTAEGGKERKGQSSQAGLIDSAYQPSLTLRLRERGRIFGALASRVSSLSYFLKVSMSFNFLMSALLCKVC